MSSVFRIQTETTKNTGVTVEKCDIHRVCFTTLSEQMTYNRTVLIENPRCLFLYDPAGVGTG